MNLALKDNPYYQRNLTLNACLKSNIDRFLKQTSITIARL
jgi:hypothetical protein